MKEAVGSYWLTIIFITFIVLFTGYLCLSINMNKAYKVKNEIINIIQKNNGLDDKALSQIQDYMSRVGYRNTGRCGAGEEAYNMNGSTSDGNGLFCAKIMKTEYESNYYEETQFPRSAYYTVRVFFSIDLPIIRNAFGFNLRGSTKRLFNPAMM